MAVLTQSPALASIIAMVLDCEEHLNVQTFSRSQNLQRHARIAPLDLVVCDFQIGMTTAPKLALDLRRTNPKRAFQFIALSETVDATIQQACKFACIDEVIIKPMSPVFLRDRVLARLAKEPAGLPNIVGSSQVSYNADAPLGHNIVQLHCANREIQPRI